MVLVYGGVSELSFCLLRSRNIPLQRGPTAAAFPEVTASAHIRGVQDIFLLYPLNLKRLHAKVICTGVGGAG